MESLEYQLGLTAATFAHALLALPLLGALLLIPSVIREHAPVRNRRRFASYKKVGGIHFVKLGRFGFSFWLSKRKQ